VKYQKAPRALDELPASREVRHKAKKEPPVNGEIPDNHEPLSPRRLQPPPPPISLTPSQNPTHHSRGGRRRGKRFIEPFFLFLHFLFFI